MKTVISVDEILNRSSRRVAGTLDLSRNALIADALRDYLTLKRRSQLSEQLNQAYAHGPIREEQALVKSMPANFRPSGRR